MQVLFDTSVSPQGHAAGRSATVGYKI